MMRGNKLSAGRLHNSADSVSWREWGNKFRVDIRWNDGAYVFVIYDDKAEALLHVHVLGLM